MAAVPAELRPSQSPAGAKPLVRVENVGYWDGED